MDAPLRQHGLRLFLALLSLAALSLAGFWYWHSGRSERRVPEGAYLVRASPPNSLNAAPAAPLNVAPTVPGAPATAPDTA